MATQLVRARLPMPQEVAAYGLSPAKWRVLTEAIFPTARTVEGVVMALEYCKARGLDPFKRPVHIVPMWNKELKKEVETVWPGINSIQTDAARTGEWAGMDPPQWGPEMTRQFSYEEQNGRLAEFEVTFPSWCEVTVWRMVKGQRCPFTERVYWLESYSTRSRWSEAPNDIWRRRPHGQLHKCAKAAVLRAAFPEAADYAAEEMEGKPIEAGGVVIEGRPEQAASDGPANENPPHDPETGEVQDDKPAGEPAFWLALPGADRQAVSVGFADEAAAVARVDKLLERARDKQALARWLLASNPDLPDVLPTLGRVLAAVADAGGQAA